METFRYLYSRLVIFERVQGHPYQATEFDGNSWNEIVSFIIISEIKQAIRGHGNTLAFNSVNFNGQVLVIMNIKTTCGQINATFYLHPLFNYDGTSLPAIMMEQKLNWFNTDTTLTTDNSNCTTRSSYKGDYR